MNCYDRLHTRGLKLPQVPTPIGNFTHCTREGNLLFLSGQGPLDESGSLMTGKVGATVSADEAYRHAQMVGLNLLAVLHNELGDLRRVKQRRQAAGHGQRGAGFHRASARDQRLLGSVRRCIRRCRSAFPLGGRRGLLPGNITVEIEAIVAIQD